MGVINEDYEFDNKIIINYKKRKNKKVYIIIIIIMEF